MVIKNVVKLICTAFRLKMIKKRGSKTLSRPANLDRKLLAIFLIQKPFILFKRWLRKMVESQKARTERGHSFRVSLSTNRLFQSIKSKYSCTSSPKRHKFWLSHALRSWEVWELSGKSGCALFKILEPYTWKASLVSVRWRRTRLQFFEFAQMMHLSFLFFGDNQLNILEKGRLAPLY